MRTVGLPACAGMRGLVGLEWAEADRRPCLGLSGLAVWVQGGGPALGPGRGFSAVRLYDLVQVGQTKPYWVSWGCINEIQARLYLP